MIVTLNGGNVQFETGPKGHDLSSWIGIGESFEYVSEHHPRDWY